MLDIRFTIMINGEYLSTFLGGGGIGWWSSTEIHVQNDRGQTVCAYSVKKEGFRFSMNKKVQRADFYCILYLLIKPG